MSGFCDTAFVIVVNTNFCAAAQTDGAGVVGVIVKLRKQGSAQTAAGANDEGEVLSWVHIGKAAVLRAVSGLVMIVCFAQRVPVRYLNPFCRHAPMV